MNSPQFIDKRIGSMAAITAVNRVVALAVLILKVSPRKAVDFWT